MAGYAPISNGSAPVLSGVRQRALFCFLAATLALFGWDWLPSVTLRGAPGITSTGVTINGARIDLACRGRGPASVIIIGDRIVPEIDEAAQAELARFVHLCTLTIIEGAARRDVPDFGGILFSLLITSNAPSPYVIIARASPPIASEWVAGPSATPFVGFVLIDPPDQPASLVVSAGGDQRPLPTDDRDAMVLAILSLFWPPDDT